MYKLLLIFKYLRRKLAPLFAAMAVTLCTAMVIIVISVMGGFLDLMRHAAQRLTGQVTVSADLWGYPHYDKLLTGLNELPEVDAAAAIVRAYGLINLNSRVITVEVVGIDPASLDTVTGYRDTLYWTSQHILDDLDRSLPSLEEMTPRQRAFYESRRQFFTQTELRDAAMIFTLPHQQVDPSSDSEDPGGEIPGVRGETGVVMGIEVSPYSQRNQDGEYILRASVLDTELTLTVLPLTRRGTVMEPSVKRMTVVNEFKSGLYEIDANRVYVPFELLQQMLRMDPAEQADPETGEPTGKIEPARASEIMIRGKPGIDLATLGQAVTNHVNQFQAAHTDVPPLWVQTWKQRHATLLGAVEKEKLLLTFLFGLISIVAVAMIGVIFYMIVLEKTRDIGVLRAIGGSRGGVMAIFLGYGLAIGCIGAGLGSALAAGIVYRINEIQDLLTRYFNFTMWDPTVYYFDRVPSQLDPTEVTVIVIVAILSSVLGALIPAYLASRLNPIESLRYE